MMHTIRPNHCSNMNSPKGMSLVEVLIVMTVVGMMALGITSMIKNMVSIQKRMETKNILSEYRKNLIFILSNDNAWKATLEDSNNRSKLGCLRDSSPGCGTDPYRITNFKVVNTDNSTFYQGRPIDGFDRDGRPCSGFDAVSGNNACPFRYELELVARCKSGVPPCYKPLVTINGTLQFSPENKSHAKNRFNLTQYNFTVNRANQTRYEPFIIRRVISSTNNTNPGPPPNDGSCNPAVNSGWNRRPIDPERPGDDVGNNVAVLNQFQFSIRPGTYKCKVTAQTLGAGNGSIAIGLYDVTNARRMVVGGGHTSSSSTLTISGSVDIELSSAAEFEIQQFCPVGHTPNNYDFGRPINDTAGGTGYNSGTLISSISCIRTS